MKIAITGGTGLIGSELTKSLIREGHQLTSLVREAKLSPDDPTIFVRWDIERGEIESPSKLEAHDAVIHLAGESVAEGRWTEEKKRRIHDSRVKGTRLLVETLVRLKQPPKILLSASAIGFYGADRSDEILTEESSPGADFLAGVSREWEAGALRAKDFGARVVLLRTGIVLSPDGGALRKMLPLFKMGIGGKLGSGRQFMSWIALKDEIAAIRFALVNETVGDAINLTAPHPVTNAEFTETIGRVLSRPTFLRVPPFALRLALGEMAATALGSLRVLPKRLEAAGYQFEFTELENALRQMNIKRAD
ncbi:MAG: epimerase [Spartobacteria bacterium]|nr:epimerase [Spartobacteria bacterium]